MLTFKLSLLLYIALVKCKELIEQPNCQIPDIDPFDETVLPFIRPTAAFTCYSDDNSLVYRDDAHLKINLTELAHVEYEFSNCQYQLIHRCCPEAVDSVYKYSKPIRLNTDFVSAFFTHERRLQANRHQNESDDSSQEIDFSEDPAVLHIGGLESNFIRVDCYNVLGVRLQTQYFAVINDFTARPRPDHTEIYQNPINTPIQLGQNTDTIYSQSEEYKSTSDQQQSYRQRKAQEQNAEKMNVLMLGIDSVSRLNSVRKLRRTRDYLTTELGAIEMLGYNKVADNTFPNLLPLLTGRGLDELGWDETLRAKPFDRYTFLWDEYRERGDYWTLMAEDAPEIAIFNYLKAGFASAPTHYYHRPHSIAMEEFTPLWEADANGPTTGCFAGEREPERILRWVTEFASRRDRTPQFSFTFLTRLSHADLNGLGAGDEIYSDFFRTLHERGDLNNTVVVFFSDHGLRFGDILETDSGQLEERLPMLFVAFPPWFRQRYAHLVDVVRENAKKLVTTYDVHKTLTDILFQNFPPKETSWWSSLLDGDEKPEAKFPPDHPLSPHRYPPHNQRGLSLFKAIPGERSCANAHIPPHWCACLRYTTLTVEPQSTSWSALLPLRAFLRPSNEISRELAKSLAKSIVDNINNLLTPYRKLCYVLELARIRKIRRADVRYSQNSYRELYLVTIETNPSQGLFAATVSLEGDTVSVEPEISRLDSYRGQSDCVPAIGAKKFCYCY